ncbi:bile acid 7-alpha-dehydratase [Lactobacillus plantarum subsp. plantarum ST-III] [Lactiplantibacillus mudanjiangensis]|uniref:nuclear transport factor 2 family protein n=1 Tax=Lactiplantibacillus mudanjiangensis TaxID=1296538 RepID=UPI001013FB33|nr:bile acid 7-alpha-dehydratase [Lactobacillus plantarum subsp. plantarum ST-III] [Lactiplantibacillus mudanjiangensis]
MNVQEISDRLELKEVVDLFSNYADTKENEKQVQLFTADGVVNIINDGKVTFTLSGRDAILKAFSRSMADYQSVFHMSGQQTVDFVDGTHATGVAYNLVVLVKQDEDGTLTTTQEGVRYEDKYEKVAGKWLIAERNSHFNWHLDNH